MYFPVGWPKLLDSNGATKGAPVKVLRHRCKNYVIEIRENSVAFWHSRLTVLVSSYVRSKECMAKHGVNITAALKQDGSALLLATSKGHLLFLRLSYELSSNLSTSQGKSFSTRNHGILLHHTTNLEVAGEGNELELINIKFYNETAVVGNIVSVLCVGAQLVISTDFGVLHRLSWDGRYDSSLLIHLHRVPFANDLLPESRVQPLGEDSKLYAKDIVYSPELRGFSLVLSDGRGAFITAKSARYEPQTLQGVWIKDLTQAVCSTVNYRYKLLSFGKEDGSVDVYSVDDSTGVWTLSHSLKFTKQQFPEASLFLGPVQCLEWSYGDASVIAVSWKSGGLSLWSVFGSLLLCSLGDQPGTPSPFNPHCTILESLCWSSDTYHLWMLPTTISQQKAGWALFRKESSSSEREADNPSAADGRRGQGAKESSNESKEPDGCRGSRSSDVLVMRFMKNSIVDNPVIDNHHHLFLQGSDRLYLNVSRRHWTAQATTTAGGVGVATSGSAGNVSSPQWKVIQLPLSYLVLNWPVKYAALDSTATNLAVAGKAGFALYSGSRRRWKLFGNEVQEQGLVCRGGLAWYKDIIVFPCRVQERDEEIRFYSLHSNLDNSQLLHNLKSTSPIIRLNVLEDLLVLASRDCHMTILGLKLSIIPNKGMVLSVDKLHELSLAKSLPQPWPTSLIAMVPSTIRTEPAPSSFTLSSGAPATPPSSPSSSPAPLINSVVFNLSGKLLLIQKEPSNSHKKNQLSEDRDHTWFFSQPVCLAGSVETIWTPPTDHTHQQNPITSSSSQTQPSSSSNTPHSQTESHHLLESLWLACGAAGIKVWLPLYPRDEAGHPTFLSKRIMLTLPITVYPQTVLFSDAILYGLSHETTYSESSVSSLHSFPYATIERTTHVFLHHILRLLLRRNLGSHALQIARTCSHLPYFSHVLELMLHEILEEEAPGSMPVPDALLPRIVDFIKQFPEFLETVGHCARKTEVALWQYLFAAVGNPKDLFELCISDGRLKTAATYLIIIQNLETASVSRQLATRLLDAALESNMWQLCKDIVRFLRAIGPGDLLESPHITMAMSPLKMPTPTSGSTPSPLATVTNGLNTPDLDRSAMSIARDHLSSGSTSAVVSLSGDYKDASGKVIRRPQFVMDVDSKEEYFIELILSRHARKLLTARSLRDLGKFSAHLDFTLSSWLARERLRAARLDEFVPVLQELHREFRWPYPAPPSGSSPQPHLLPPGSSHQPHLSLREQQTTKHFSPNSTLQDSLSPPQTTPTDHMTPRAATPVDTTNDDGVAMEKRKNFTDNFADESTSSLKRANRPPDLNLSPGRSAMGIPVELANQKLVGVAAIASLRSQSGGPGDFDPTRSSTPTKQSGSISERVSLVYKKNASSQDLNAENSSMGDILEESDWDVNSDIAMATDGRGGALMKRSLQTEKEIRYFADVAMEAQCLEWSVLLSILLMDASLLSKVVGGASGWGLDAMILARTARCYEEVYDWAEAECPGYLHFLGAISGEIETLKSLPPALPVSSSPANSITGSQLTPTPSISGEDKTDLGVMNMKNQLDRLENSPGQPSSDENASGCNIS